MSGFTSLRQSLISKFTVATSVVLLVAIALFAYINIKTLTDLFIREAKDDVETVSEIILHTTHFQMLEDNRERVYQMMEEVSSHEKIQRIRLFSTSGMIHFSTNPNEVNRTITQAAESCRECHCDKVFDIFPPLENSRRIFRDCKGNELLSVTTEIHNKPACSQAACHVHPAGQQVLGILEVQGSLKNVGVQAGLYRNTIITFAVCLLVVVAACLTWLTRNLVILPVRHLLVQARNVSRMDLDSRIEFSAHDEIGELAKAFNDMTVKLKQARDEYQELTDTLEAKVVERTDEIAQVHYQLVRSEKLASLGQLVSGIAHEINNPLAGILMFATMFTNDQRLDDNLREDARIIVRETQRCAEIVKRLLDFSRRSIPDKQPSSLPLIMENTLALVEHHAVVNDIEVIRQYHLDLPEIMVDPTQLEQVFINLLVNACQAMSGGGRLTIAMDADPTGACLVTSIADTGHGIADDHLAKIFDPFFTTKEPTGNSNAGTGLGLSVSYGIIQNHGGRIGVQSMLGQGTTFVVELPIGTGGHDDSGLTAAPAEHQG